MVLVLTTKSLMHLLGRGRGGWLRWRRGGRRGGCILRLRRGRRGFGHTSAVAATLPGEPARSAAGWPSWGRWSGGGSTWISIASALHSRRLLSRQWAG